MSDLQSRLKALERLKGGRGGRQPVAIWRTEAGEHYLLKGDTRTLIGSEGAFQRWLAEGNFYAVIFDLSDEGCLEDIA